MKQELFHKITKAKLNPRVGNLLDSCEIEFALLNALEDMIIVRVGHVHLNSQFAYFEYGLHPMILALVESGVFYR